MSLEPGGQIEFISAPRNRLDDLENDLCADLKRVLDASGENRYWLAMGLQPVTPLKSMEWISRERYRIMASHLGARGKLAHLMMTQTAGIQLNVDFRDDADAASKLRTSMGVTSIITAAFANSPFSDGKPNGWTSYRSHIWMHTDPDRCGLIRQAVEGDGMDLEAWTDWALDIPVLFVIRDGIYRALDGRTFRQYMADGYEDYTADIGDWQIHLTTLFPEVRVKTYMEVRGIDGVSRPLAIAGVALWKGILYSETACENAWKLVADLSWEERLALHEEAGRRGTAGTLRGRSLGEWALDLLEIAREGLRDPSRAIPADDEERFLEPLEGQLREGGGSPALELLERWHGEWNQDPALLVKHTALTPCQIRISDG